MYFERIAARVLLAVGMCVLLATSEEQWSEGQTSPGRIESQGNGDDKLVRMRITITGALLRKSDGAWVSLNGKVDRPASDVRFEWTENSPVSEGNTLVPFHDAGPRDASPPVASSEDAGAGDAEVDMRSVDASVADADAGSKNSGPVRGGTYYSDGFTRLSIGGDLLTQWCVRSADGCVLVVEARVTAASSAPYVMDLRAGASVSGGGDEPRGSVRVEVEVHDAP
jgi:hypothetical protein